MMQDYIYDTLLDEEPITDEEMFTEDESELMHYGTPRHSGRYPWGSGDKPFQRSSDFYSRVNALRKDGVSDKDIATSLGMSTSQFRNAYSMAKDDIRRDRLAYAKSLRDDGYSNVEIGMMVGKKYNPNGAPVNESTIRNLFNEDAEVRMNLATKTANELRDIVDKNGFVDVGVGSEQYLNQGLGITETKLSQALDMLYMEGYELYNVRTPQVTNKGKWTTLKILCRPDTKYAEAYKAAQSSQVKSIFDFHADITRDDERPNTFIYPASMDSKRLAIRYDEDGGTLKDGVVEIRPGVKDLSLGDAKYSQVRILVDGTHYIKGMAVYGKPEDFPDGVDIIFNSNKSKAKVDKMGALKKIDENIRKDPTNPFGSYIKDVGGQSFYDDPNGKYTDPVTGHKQSLSLINKRSDEGDWDAWSRELSSQFLSKQSKSLIRRQIKISEEEKQAEFDEIMALSNPTVKRHLLNDFAEDCDSASVHLKAASLPGQTYKVILPLTTLKDTEVYAPHLPNGTKVALVRYPHAGTFEIPVLTVNNNNKEGKDVLGTTPMDAIGITKHVADRMSGADFDGDTVMVIPTNDDIRITSTNPLPQLEGFDTKLMYGPDGPDSKVTIDGVDYGIRGGHRYPRITNMQTEMGKVSNLITDMTLKGAPREDIAKAVKHSMVIVDSEKHWLDYKQSEIDNEIPYLKKKYQGHINPVTGRYSEGSSTLISKAKSAIEVDERKDYGYFTKDKNIQVQPIETTDGKYKQYKDPKTGKIYSGNEVRMLKSNPITGEKAYTYTNREYQTVSVKMPDGTRKNLQVYDKDGKKYYKNQNGEYVEITNEKINTKKATQTSTKMAEVSDAHILSYGTPQEEAYADYANKLKSLANQARKEAYAIEDIPYSPEANKEYREEVLSLKEKYNEALKNAPKERQAQIIAGSVVKTILQDNPSLDEDHKNKLKQNELKKARAKLGANRVEIYITDKEWEAIQAGAITKTMLNKIIMKADGERLKQLALPKEQKKLSASKANRITSLSKVGYTSSEIAKFLGVSVSTVNNYLQEKKGN